jgi:hypothetical protein
MVVVLWMRNTEMLHRVPFGRNVLYIDYSDHWAQVLLEIYRCQKTVVMVATDDPVGAHAEVPLLVEICEFMRPVRTVVVVSDMDPTPLGWPYGIVNNLSIPNDTPDTGS